MTFSGMIRVHQVVQVQVFMVAAVQALDFKTISINRTTKAVITSRVIKGINSSQVTRVTRSS